MPITKHSLRRWLWAQRTSSRMAFLLQLGRRGVSSFFSLMWAVLLYRAMGPAVNSLYLGLQGIFSMGGLGDLGMGGAVSIRAGQYLGEGKEKELQKFLSSARAVFLILALTAGLVMVALSPWLPQWLIGREVSEAGSLHMAFVMGAVMIAGVVLNSYISNLNYACGNIVWPIIPSLLLLQVNMLATWLLARQHFPLWVQFAPTALYSFIEFYLLKTYIKLSHPPLAALFPIKLEWRSMLILLESSGWIYLCGLGNSIYRNTDLWVINANRHWPLGIASQYNYNYRFCDLAVLVVLTASFVTLPKITQWMASTDPKDQARVRVEMRRLNQFQTLLGCGAALAYLAGNDLFIKLWWRPKPGHTDSIEPIALIIQLAFALNLAVTTSGDTSIQLAMRSGKKGLRVAGLAIGLTGLLNLVLSVLAMKANSLWGIAMATVIAQSVLSLVTGRYLCRHLQMTWWSWAFKSWLVPVAGIIFAGWLRMQWPLDSWPHSLGLIGAYLALLALAAWGLGVTLEFIREELRIVLKSFRR